METYELYMFRVFIYLLGWNAILVLHGPRVDDLFYSSRSDYNSPSKKYSTLQSIK